MTTTTERLSTAVASAIGSLLLSTALGLAQPVVKDATTSIYAKVPDPQTIAFAPDGTLYAGRDNSGSGGGYSDPVKIHRVAGGGSPVTEFGAVVIEDPDVVIVDAAGAVSGTAGAVLVGGGGGSNGKISKVAPDGTVTTLFGPSANYQNPSGFAFDLAGRFLFTCNDNGRVYASDGGTPTLLFTLTHADWIEVDTLNRIVVNSTDENALRLYTGSGVLSNANFATAKAGTPLARGRGGSWGTDIYAVGAGGELLRVALNGTVTNVGSGFSSVSGLCFGPDGALYASEFVNDRIYRFAQPTVSGAQTTIYARVSDPIGISFAPDGTLFVGRDNAGSGGGNVDPVKIHRIAPGGSPVTEYGNSIIYDPDAITYDAAGTISGTAGSVIVGGENFSSLGILSRIAPDGTVTTLFGPSSAIINPSDFVFDATGRLLFTDFEGGKVFAMTNATPFALCSLSRPLNLTMDGLGRIVVSSEADSFLHLYTASGALVTNALAACQSRSPLTSGSGGFWGTGVYFVNTNGALMRVDTNGVVAQAGVGFGGLEDFAFGPDGALYASHFDNDLIWRIAPQNTSPSITTIRDGTNLLLVWPSVNGTWYQVQWATNLPPASWAAEGAPLSGTGEWLTNTIPIGSEPGKFFRLLLLGN